MKIKIRFFNCVKAMHQGFSRFKQGECVYSLHYAATYQEYEKICIKRVFEDETRISYQDTFNKVWLEGELETRNIVKYIIEKNINKKSNFYVSNFKRNPNKCLISIIVPKYNNENNGIKNLNLFSSSTLSEDYILNGNQNVAFVDATLTNISIFLPDARLFKDKLYIIKKMDDSENLVYVRSIYGKMDGYDVFPLKSINSVLTFISNGEDWNII